MAGCLGNLRSKSKQTVGASCLPSLHTPGSWSPWAGGADGQAAAGAAVQGLVGRVQPP